MDSLKFILENHPEYDESVYGVLSFQTPQGVFKIHKDTLDSIRESIADGFTLHKPDGGSGIIRQIAHYVLYKSVAAPKNKYHRKLTVQDVTVTVDVYDVINAYAVTCPALQHLIKKALCCGLRGHKDRAQDLQDILDSATRAKELHGE